jgi:hypothetical protein
MGACTSVTRDRDPISAANPNIVSSGVSKVTPFIAFKEGKSGNFGELNNSITVNRQQSIKKKKTLNNDDGGSIENNDDEEIEIMQTDSNEFRIAQEPPKTQVTAKTIGDLKTSQNIQMSRTLTVKVETTIVPVPTLGTRDNNRLLQDVINEAEQ